MILGLLVEVICEYVDELVVQMIVGNMGVDLIDCVMEYLIEWFLVNVEMYENLVLCDYILVYIVEKMVFLVFGQVFDMLINWYELLVQMVIDFVVGVCECVIIDLVEQVGCINDLLRFVLQFNFNG